MVTIRKYLNIPIFNVCGRKILLIIIRTQFSCTIEQCLFRKKKQEHNVLYKKMFKDGMV